jgi:hypothetical protein
MQTKFFKPLLVACMLMASIPSSFAQYVAATTNDILAGSAEEPQNVNCDRADFIKTGALENFNVVAWDNYPTTGNPYIKVLINFRSYTIPGTVSDSSIIITNATRPDLIIGHDISGGFFVGLVYEQSGSVKFTQYYINWAAPFGPVVGVSLDSPKTTILATTGEWPHIDGFVDSSAGITPGLCFPIPSYVVSWHENSGTGNMLHGATGSFGVTPKLDTILGLNYMFKDVVNSDVSAYTDAAGNKMANFIFTRTNSCGATEMWVETKNVNTTAASTSTLLETGASLHAPRIESQSWNPVAHGNVTWMGVCPKLNTSTSKYEVTEYDPNHVGAVQNVMPAFANTYECAAISGGAGVDVPGGAINSYYAPKWNDAHGTMMYGMGTAKLKFRGIHATTSVLFDTSYGPNKANEVPPYTGFAVAAASSSTSGHDILIAWSHHTYIAYKYVYDTISSFHFRPEGETGIDETTEEVDGISVYANPTTNNIMLKGIDHGTYIIYDVSGKKMASGNVEQGHSIYTENLAAGTYYIELNEDNKISKLPFIKQ